MNGVDAWRGRFATLAFKIGNCLDNAYESAQIIWEGVGEGKPWSWKKIHRKWTLFQSVPKSPSRIAERLVREA